jgi:nucleotide-binding universal stress UspA family protein
MASARPIVLVGYDGSEPAQRALEHAAELVGPRGSVSVINVIRAQSVSSRWVTVTDKEQATQDRLLRESERVLARLGVDANIIAAAGDPATEILTASKSIGAGVIVIGRRKRSTPRLIRTPLSNTLVRRAGIDVLVVH